MSSGDIATLGGTLLVETMNSFTPGAGGVCEIISATEAISTTFEQTTLPSLPKGLKWELDYSENGISLEVIVDLLQIGGSIVIDVVDGDLVLRDGEGGTVPATGQSLTLQVTPKDEFESTETWDNTGTEVVDGVFVQTVTNGEYTLRIEGSGWTNFVEPADVNGTGDVSPIDALAVLNQLVRDQNFKDGTNTLVDPASVAEFPGKFYDVNGDGEATPIDALRILNQLARDLAKFGGEASPAIRRSDVAEVETVSEETSEVLSETKHAGIASTDAVFSDWQTTDEESSYANLVDEPEPGSDSDTADILDDLIAPLTSLP